MTERTGVREGAPAGGNAAAGRISERDASERGRAGTSTAFGGRVGGDPRGSGGRGPGRGRPALIAGAWVGGIAIVALAAVAGGIGGDPAAGPAAVASAASAAPPSPATAAAGGDVPADRVIFLQEPGWDGAVVTTRELVVRGMVPAGTGPVRIGLGSASGKALAFETIDPVPGLGGQPHAFSIELPAGGPRPGGSLTVQVIAYDAHGIPIDVVRRRVVLGPIERTVGGEDGLMGGLTD